MNAVQYFQLKSSVDNRTRVKVRQTKAEQSNTIVDLNKKKAIAKTKVRNSHGELAIETGVKLVINGLLTYVAISTIFKLYPHYQDQQVKLAEINAEVKETQIRVEKLREKFGRSFDPTQTKTIIQMNSDKVDPNQRRIFFNPQNP